MVGFSIVVTEHMESLVGPSVVVDGFDVRVDAIRV